MDDRPLEVININAASKKETKSFVSNYTPAANSIMTGDFNTHHSIWYGDKSDNKALIRNSSNLAEFLVDWVGRFGFTLQNMPRVFSHFPSNGNSSSIIDLTFTRGHATTITSGLSCEAGLGGDSDHAPTTTALRIKPPTFIPRHLHHKTDWAAFIND